MASALTITRAAPRLIDVIFANPPCIAAEIAGHLSFIFARRISIRGGQSFWARCKELASGDETPMAANWLPIMCVNGRKSHCWSELGEGARKPPWTSVQRASSRENTIETIRNEISLCICREMKVETPEQAQLIGSSKSRMFCSWTLCLIRCSRWTSRAGL